jgi:hypothetical protein
LYIADTDKPQEFPMPRVQSRFCFHNFVIVNLLPLSILLLPSPALFASITWAGHTWNVTTGGMAGNNTGAAANVTVDSTGYLHLAISKSGTAWTCAEMFSADTMGFGTYRWLVDAPVDKLDKNVVLGLFPYGPEGGVGADGTNEIDIEYARWGNSAWPNGNYTVYPNSGSTVGETTFNFTLSSTYTTSWFVWTGTGIAFTSQEGLKAAGDSTGIIKRWTYVPANPGVNIPQRAMPLGMNLWLCSGCGGAPSNGQSVEVIIRSFQFIPLGTAVDEMMAGTGRAPSAGFSIHGGCTALRLDNPAPRDIAVCILDMHGRVLQKMRMSKGEREATITRLNAGVYAVTLPEIGIVQRVFVVR